MKTLRALLPAVLLAMPLAGHATIINLDASHGFTYDWGGSDPAPLPGQHINFIGTPETLTLGAGRYAITYAGGLSGGLFEGWSFNTGESPSWAWAFVIADAASQKVILYGEAQARAYSAAQLATMPAVRDFRAIFELPATTELAFTLRDYYVPDNAGGVSLQVLALPREVEELPEPASLGMAWLGLAALSLSRRRTSGKRDPR
ncbi:hypothetical protein [Niveibacterium sp. SC-1]|uniref:hypothetical protein n=1 Tax=Niveibacterium sp. SC-1 TaxID=3135646 RepID=UPI00311ED1ED